MRRVMPFATALLAALVLVAFLPATALAAHPPEGSWSDDFSTTRKVDATSDTRVTGGALKLGENVPPVDMGPAVPGEGSVASLVALGADIYCGTGETGHLVKYDADRLFQEGREGPGHYGVSSSKGQVLDDVTTVTALTTDGTGVFGGTADGDVFEYDPSDEGNRPDDKGTCPGATGAVSSSAWYLGLAHFGTADGYLFSFDPVGDAFVNLGQVPGASAVNALTVVGATLYIALDDGHLCSYAGGGPGAFTDLGAVAAAPLNALSPAGTVLYIGAGTLVPPGTDGRLYGYDTAAPGPFVDCGGPAGASPLRALAVSGAGLVYCGAQDGHLYSFQPPVPGTWSDEGTPADSGGQPVNSIVVTAGGVLYGGTGSSEAGATGRLFRRGAIEAHANPPEAGAIESIIYSAKKLLLARGEWLLAYTSPGEASPYVSIGRPAAGETILDMDSWMGTVFMGMSDGHLWAWNEVGGFTDMGTEGSASPANAVLARLFATVYVGLGNGKLMDGNDMAGPPIATIGAGINDLVYKEGGGGAQDGLYAAGADGKLYRLNGASLDMIGDSGDALGATALAVFADSVYMGCAGGGLYRWDGTSFAPVAVLPSGIASMAPGAQGVFCGTAAGTLAVYDTALRWAPAAPGEIRSLCHVNSSVWAGTAAGDLRSYDDAYLGDLDQQVKKQIMIWCMTYDPVRHLFYAGTYRNAHFLVIDPATNGVRDLGRPIPGERELEDIIITREGAVVGCTYGGTEELYNPDGGHLFTFDPVAMDFTDRGRAPAPDNNWWISSLAEGPSSGPAVVYGATSNSAVDATHLEGRFFSVDKATWVATDLGVPVPGEGTRSLTVRGDYIYGATWDPAVDYESSVYSYTTGGPFADLGEAPTPAGQSDANKHVNRLLALSDTSRVYAAQNNGYVFSFDPDEPVWTPSQPAKPVPTSDSVYPLARHTDGTLLTGTTGSEEDPILGHLVDFDPALGAFRDIDVTSITDQDRVSAIAAGDAAVGQVTFCGTRGMMVAGDRQAARLFRVDPYKTPGEFTALSTVVDPAMSELMAGTAPFAGQKGIGAICAAPGGAKQLFVGTYNDPGATDACLFLYDTMADLTVGNWPTTGQDQIRALGLGPDGKLYIGTSDGAPGAKLLRFDPSNPGPPVDLNVSFEANTNGVFSITQGPDGKVYVGTGNSTSKGGLYSYDPATQAFVNIGACDPSSSRVTGLVSAAGKVYGTTSYYGAGNYDAEFFEYTPGGSIVGRGVIHATEERSNALISGPGNKLYAATGPDGLLLSCPVGGSTFSVEQDLAGEPTALAATSLSVFGSMGGQGRLFRFTPGTGFSDLGPLDSDGEGAYAAAVDSFGNPHLGTTGGTGPRLVRYDTNAAFRWETVAATVDAAPPVRNAFIDVMDEPGTVVLKSDVLATPDPNIQDLTAEALRLRARLSTTNTTLTPSIDSWQVNWTRRASIDEYQYPHAEGVYRGEDLGIWGGDFGDNPGTVTINGRVATVDPGNWHDTYIRAQVPLDAGGAGGVVIEPAGAGLPNQVWPALSLLDEPHIDAIAPTAAHLGDVVDVSGTGFTTGGENDAVTFNGIGATSYALWSDTLIKAVVPAGASSGEVRVSVNSHVSNAVPFTLISGGGPTVDITGPAEGATLKGTVKVSATVIRQDGTSPVELWLDGSKAASDPWAPYEFDWDTDTATDGAHALEVRAADGYGRTGSDSMTAYVDHTVPSESTVWYFAEGCTDYGFETWVLIGNSSDGVAHARVTFMDDAGLTFERAVTLDSGSRASLNAADVAPGANVSIKVTSDVPVVCERAMYWAGRSEGHSTVGTTEAAPDWYFAEGCTDFGFETFVLVGNPADAPVTATLRYMFEDGTTAVRAHLLAPHSRLTVNAAEEVGAREFSVRVEAPAGVVAERSMYHGGRRCGTGTIGAKAPSTTWFLSEGSTDWGFETWLLIQRAGAGDARVQVSYRKGDGQTVSRTYTVKGDSRYTVNLADEVGVADVSTQVTSDVPVVCERSMYWAGRAAGHCSIGSPAPGRTWYLAEGCTDYGFETWLLLDNPSGSQVSATLRLMKQDAATVPVTIVCQPHSRTSIDASTYVGAASFSTSVSASEPIMLERAMYWHARGGGTGSIGAR